MLLKYSKKSISDLAISSAKKLEYELNKTLDLPFFIDELLRKSVEDDKVFQGCNTDYSKPYPREIKIAPDINTINNALTGIDKELRRIDESDLVGEKKYNEKKSLILDTIKPKKIIKLDKSLGVWWGDTKKGINMRTGFVNNDRSKNIPFTLGGNQAQILAGGNTGEGKSVVMNTILISWLIEYAPWELTLIMNDLKKQEYGRYDGLHHCPQIKNICLAAHPGYMISELEHIYNEMLMLADVCVKIGTNSYEGLRSYLDMAIPSVVVPSDEWSQLKENSKSKELARAFFLVQSIVKLGRSYHRHLLLTSQTFKEALPSDTLTQFKMGIAVGAGEDNSTSLIGNAGAVALTKKRGYCLVNVNRVAGDIKDNVEYKVPFLDDKTDEEKRAFQDLLGKAEYPASILGITDRAQVFNDTEQVSWDTVVEDMELYKEEIEKDYAQSELDGLVMSILMGRGMRFSGNPRLCEYIHWSKTKKSNLLINSRDVKKLNYMTELLAENMKFNGLSKIKQMVYIDNRKIYKKVLKNIKVDESSDFNTDDFFNEICNRSYLLAYSNLCKAQGVPIDSNGFLVYYCKKKELQVAYDFFSNHPEICLDDLAVKMLENGLTEEEIGGTWIKDLLSVNGLRDIFEEVMFVLDRYCNDLETYLTPDSFGQNIIWMYDPKFNEGVFKRDYINPRFLKCLELGPQVGFNFIIIMSDMREMRDIIRNCEHMLIAEPGKELETMGVEFSDNTGLCCRYVHFNGVDSENKYFKEYLKYND